MKRLNKLLAVATISFTTLPIAFAETEDESQINIGVVFDGRFQEGERSLSEFEDGFSLGETELTLFGNIDDKFRGVLTPVLEFEDGETEVDVEEAFIEAAGLAPGFNLRAEFGYLNPVHLHEDDFADRPAVYRAFLGDHYFDNGIAADFLAPTDQFFSVTLEVFDGAGLSAPDTPESELDTVNVVGGSVNIGGDSGVSNSWQFGLSGLFNENGMVTTSSLESHEDGEEEEDGHGHEAALTGDTILGLDFIWKWAPNGNLKDKNLTLSADIRLDDLFDSAVGSVEGAPDSVDGWYLSAVYQFAPSWTFGLRYGEVDIYEGEAFLDEGVIEGEFDQETISEVDVSLAWSSSHFSTVRVTYTREELDGHEGTSDENIFVLQYVMSLGAHRSHTF